MSTKTAASFPSYNTLIFYEAEQHRVNNFILWSWWHKAQYSARFSSPKPQKPPACTWCRLHPYCLWTFVCLAEWLSAERWWKPVWLPTSPPLCSGTHGPTCCGRYFAARHAWSVPTATSSAFCSGMTAKMKGKKLLIWATDINMMWSAWGYMAAFINIINSI